MESHTFIAAIKGFHFNLEMLLTMTKWKMLVLLEDWECL